MKVQCKCRDIGSIDDICVRARLRQTIHRDHADDDLIEGKVYPVLAIALWPDGGVRIYLHTVESSSYPYPYPLEMFDVVDATMSADWKIGFEKSDCGTSIRVITFPAWVDDVDFYERLVEGDEKASATYNAELAILNRLAN
jgi:hypothetical protein